MSEQVNESFLCQKHKEAVSVPVKIPMVGGMGVADKKVTPGLRSIYLQNSMTSFNMIKERIEGKGKEKEGVR